MMAEDVRLSVYVVRDRKPVADEEVTVFFTYRVLPGEVSQAHTDAAGLVQFRYPHPAMPLGVEIRVRDEYRGPYSFRDGDSFMVDLTDEK